MSREIKGGLEVQEKVNGNIGNVPAKKPGDGLNSSG
jgi:hypothetical protein